MSASELALTLPLAGMQLIEASAGTGKTYTIAGLYLRLIVEKHLSVRELLVVTYTRAATDELKQRLRARLHACANLTETRLARADMLRPDGDAGALHASSMHASLKQASSPPRDETQFAQVLIERALAAGEPLLDLARRLRLEASSIDEAAIHTIHAFCARVLREQAFASGEAFDAGELIGSDRDLIAEIAADIWRRHASGAQHAADFDVLRDKVGTPEALGRIMRALTDDTIELQPRPAAANEATQRAISAARDVCVAAEADLGMAWCVSGETDLARIRVAAESGQLKQTTFKSDSIAEWREALRHSVGEGRPVQRAVLEKISSDRLRDGLRKNQSAMPPLAFVDAVDRWLAAQTALDRAAVARWPNLLHALREQLRAELARRKQRAARQSYDDLIVRLHAAIADVARGARLAAALHECFPAVLIDEFQDTDQRQFEIFNAMRRAGDGVLFVVGDPKQAIYRFRGGDIFAYLAAAEASAATHRLDRNFRSSPALLRAIAAIYAPVAPDRSAFVDRRIAFHQVGAGGRAADDDVRIDGAPIVPLTLWHLPDELAGCNKETGRDALAVGCAQAIVALLRAGRAGIASIAGRGAGDSRRPLAPRDIAVLVTTNDEAILMQDMLAARGVASATIRKQSIFATAEAGEMLMLLGALESRDERRLRAALASRLFGFDATALVALVDADRPEPWLAELERLDALARIWQRHGVLAMFARMFETRAAVVLAGVGGERRMTNYLQLAEWLQHESTQVAGASGLIARLRWRIANADADSEDEQLRLEADSDRVLIATVHASKGLEYNLVFLPFTALKAGRQVAPPRSFAWHEAGRRCVRVVARGDAEDAALSAALAAAEAEELAERMRVLYVALTRARYALWLSWDVIGESGALPALAWLWHGGSMPEDSGAARAALETVARFAPDDVRIATLPAAGEERLAAIAATALPRARHFEGHVDAHWWTHSFSQWRDGTRLGVGDDNGADDEGIVADENAVDIANAADAAGAVASAMVAGDIPIWPSGPTFGVAFHEILERTDFAAWRNHAGEHAPTSEAGLISDVLRRHALLVPGRVGELTRVVTRMVATTLNARLGSTRLCDLAIDARRAEMSFHFAIAGARAPALIALLQRHGYQTQRAGFARLDDIIAGLMTGIIDLVFQADERWWLLDYKTNALGTRGIDYHGAALAAAVADGDYDLQYIIYTLALHRWLRARMPDYDYDRDFGGAVYLFVRGLDRDATRGVFIDRPPRALIEALDALLAADLRR